MIFTKHLAQARTLQLLAALEAWKHVILYLTLKIQWKMYCPMSFFNHLKHLV